MEGKKGKQKKNLESEEKMLEFGTTVDVF